MAWSCLGGASYGGLAVGAARLTGRAQRDFRSRAVLRRVVSRFHLGRLHGDAIKERYDQTRSTRDAVTQGAASAARIITGAALIIVVVFARGQLVMFQQMGFGVAVALLLDATLIRRVILPSTLTLLGNHSRYLPRWLGWLPRLEVEAPAVPDPRLAGR